MAWNKVAIQSHLKRSDFRSMLIADNFRYRPDIDGLRAIAVLVVLFFHADFGFPGGYVGVDVFFVISGYLITSLIWKELETGRFTFAKFWERRARRIVPPLVVVTVVALTAGWFVLLPADLNSLGIAAAAQSVFAANIHYWLDSGYFASGADEKPLLHTWSLAVEEQFYLIVPFVFWAMFQRSRARATVLCILGFALVISFSLSIVGVVRSPSATFYLLPTRAWELLTGSMLAFVPVVSTNRAWREAAAVMGLGLIFFAVFSYSSETPFPGAAAAIPCLGTALLIWANDRPTFIGSILASSSFVFVGLISYSLYLWHWLFFAYARYLAVGPLPVSQRTIMIGCSFLLAILSWKYIETPFRSKKLATSQSSAFAYASAGLAVVFAIGVVCIISRGFPNRFSPEALQYAAGASDMQFTHDVTTADIEAGQLLQIGEPNTRPNVLVWGDSFAMAALPAFDSLLHEKGIGGRAVTHSAVAPVFDWFLPTTKDGLSRHAVDFNNAVLAYIQRNEIRNVVLIASWSIYPSRGEENAQSFRPALVATVEKLTANGCRVWIMMSVPAPGFPVPKALALNTPTPQHPVSHDSKTTEPDFDEKTASALKRAGAIVLDPKPAFLDPATHQYNIQMNGYSLYRDGGHLSTKGAKYILLPFLREHFKQMGS